MNRFRNWLVAAGCIMVLPAFAASSKLLDAAQLKEMLNKDQPCCVVDARSEVRRKLYPVAFSVAYSPTIKPRAGAYALVIGDSDQQSLETAQAISRRSGEDAHAVKGGYATWRQVEQGSASDTPANAMPQSFTIPSNTCEHGPALQEYK